MECYIFIEPFTFYVKHFSILSTIRKVLNASIYKTYIVKSKYVFSISSTIFKISDANESEKFHNATRRHSNLQIHGYIVEQRGVQTDNNNGRFGFDQIPNFDSNLPQFNATDNQACPSPVFRQPSWVTLPLSRRRETCCGLLCR